MKHLTIEAPWYTFQKKVDALFEQDPDIVVGEIYVPTDGSVNFAFDLEILNHEKFLALDRLLPKIRTFGNVTLGICLFDEENLNGEDDRVSLYQTIFRNNPLVRNVCKVTDFTGSRHGFVCFRPTVVQFFDDNLADLNGNWSGLAQDIAREVFDQEMASIHFCTAPVESEARGMLAEDPDDVFEADPDVDPDDVYEAHPGEACEEDTAETPTAIHA